MSAWNLAPALPPLALMDGARHLLWAVVLVWLLIGVRQVVGARGPRAAWLVASALLAVWTLWPGPASPAFWLGLAFQSPSLVTGALCAVQIWYWMVPVPGSASAPVPAQPPARQAGATGRAGRRR